MNDCVRVICHFIAIYFITNFLFKSKKTKLEIMDSPATPNSTGMSTSTIAKLIDDRSPTKISSDDLTDLSCVVQSIPAMVYTYTLNHDTGECNFPFVSDYCEEMFGLSSSSIVEDTETFVNMIHPDDVNEFAASVLYSMINLTIWDFKMRMMHKDSTIVYVHGKSRPHRREVVNEDGTITKFTIWNGALFDISNAYNEKINENKNLTQQPRRISTELVQVPSFTMKSDGTILTWNDRMTVMTQGHLKSDVVGKNLNSFVPDSEQAKNDMIKTLNIDDTINQSSCGANSALGTDKFYKMQSRDLTILSKSGQEIHLRVSYSQDGVNDIVSCICEDITKFVECEKEKINALQLLDAEKNLTEWLSHEIRNPLTVALEAAESLKMYDNKALAPVDASSSDYFVDLILNSISYVVDLMSKMLDLNKIVEGKIALRPSICSLKEDIFEKTSQMMNLKKNSVSIYIQGEDMKMYIDKLRLKQVITNLISNSLKFTKEGFIKLNSYRSTKDESGNDIPDSLFISISDSGDGIAPKDLQKLFSKWEQLNSKVNGTGIGLCLSRLLVECMGGVIYLNEKYTSNIEGSPGAQFVIRFPVDTILASKTDGTSIHNVPAFKALSAAVKSCETLMPKELQSEAQHDCSFPGDQNITHDTHVVGHYKILIVDDTAVIRKAFKRRVSTIFPQANIVEADCGEKTIELTSSGEQYDIICIDQYMGDGLTGDQTIKKLRDNHVDSLIFGISGNDKGSDHLSAGAQDFIQKPLPSQTILIKRLVQKLPPPSGWKTIIVGPDLPICILMKRKLQQVSTSYFTTIEKVEQRMSIDICANIHEAKSKLGVEWFDLIVIDNECSDDEDVASFARKHCANINVVIVSSGKSKPNFPSSQYFDLYWPKPIPTVDDLRKSLISQLMRPKTDC